MSHGKGVRVMEVCLMGRGVRVMEVCLMGRGVRVMVVCLIGWGVRVMEVCLIVSLLFLFIFFSMFFVLIHDYTLCFTGSPYSKFSYCKFSYYNYISI